MKDVSFYELRKLLGDGWKIELIKADTTKIDGVQYLVFKCRKGDMTMFVRYAPNPPITVW